MLLPIRHPHKRAGWLRVVTWTWIKEMPELNGILTEKQKMLWIYLSPDASLHPYMKFHNIIIKIASFCSTIFTFSEFFRIVFVVGKESNRMWWRRVGGNVLSPQFQIIKNNWSELFYWTAHSWIASVENVSKLNWITSGKC